MVMMPNLSEFQSLRVFSSAGFALDHRMQGEVPPTLRSATLFCGVRDMLYDLQQCTGEHTLYAPQRRTASALTTVRWQSFTRSYC